MRRGPAHILHSGKRPERPIHAARGPVPREPHTLLMKALRVKRAPRLRLGGFGKPCRVAALCYLVATVSDSATANAQARSEFFHSNQTALSGDSERVTVTDAGAVWYNPAGLGGNKRSRLDITGTALSYRKRTLKDGLTVALPDGQTLDQDLDASFLGLVAPTVVLARAVTPKLTVAAGIFVTADDRVRLRGQIEPDAATTFDYTFDTNQLRYHAGLSFGLEISPRWRVGATIFGVYEEQSNISTTAARLGEQGSAISGLVSQSVRIDSQQVGLEVGVGGQYVANDRWLLGATLRTPRLNVAETLEAAAISARGGEAAANGQLSYDGEALNRERISLGFVRPASLEFGLTHRFPHGTLSTSIDVSHAFRNDASGIERRWIANVGAGGTYALNDRLTLGGGIRTHFSDRPRPTDNLQEQVNYVNFSAGISYATAFFFDSMSTDTVGSESEAAPPPSRQPPEKRPSLIFKSIVALKYAVGFGQLATLVTNFDESRDVAPFAQRDLLFHDVVLHVGSGFTF